MLDTGIDDPDSVPRPTETLHSLIPSADDLLATPIEDLAPILLRLAAARVQAAGFIPEAVTQITLGTGFAAT
jgi:hypothetical protein